MDEDNSPQAACPQEDESRVPAEDGGVGELNERPQQGRRKRCIRMREFVLVEMVDVGDAKVQWGDEDQHRERQDRPGVRVQRDDHGAEEDFLGERSCHEVPPANPAAERFVYLSSLDPLSQARINDGFFEKRSREEKGCEQDAFDDGKGADRIYA